MGDAHLSSAALDGDVAEGAISSEEDGGSNLKASGFPRPKQTAF